MTGRWMVQRAMVGLVALVATTLAACGSGSAGTSSASGSTSASAPAPTDKVLRFAMTEPGTDVQKVWDEVKKQFEAKNAGWTLQYIAQNDDLYSTVGLPNLLNGGNAPDVYFEWSGLRLDTRTSEGHALDLTGRLAEAGITARYVDGAFGGTQVGGKTVMVPFAKDVTNVIWYSKKVFADNGIAVPTTYAELDAAASALKAKGITPFAQGNKDLWPAGNWVAHIISRIIGEQAYADGLTMKSPVNGPDWVAAMASVKTLHDKGYINPSVNSISDNEGYTLFLTGKSAMTPIGSWLVDIRKDQAKTFDMDFFNLPPIEGGKGNQQSVMGVSTGYVVNARSAKVDQAMSLFDIMTSDAIAKAFVTAGDASLVKSAAAAGGDPLSTRLLQLVENAPVVVSPPDTGYSLKVADALNTASSEVLGGAASPLDALDEAQAKIAALK